MALNMTLVEDLIKAFHSARPPKTAMEGNSIAAESVLPAC